MHAEAGERAAPLPAHLRTASTKDLKFLSGALGDANASERGWLSEPLELEAAFKAWGELQALSGVAALVVAVDSTLGDFEGAPQGSAARTSGVQASPPADLWPRLIRERQAWRERKVAGANHVQKDGVEALRFANAWPRWQTELERAKPTSEQLAEARRTLAMDRSEAGKAKVRIALLETRDRLAFLDRVYDSESLLRKVDQRAAFEEWARLYGARFQANLFRGTKTIEVPHPPTSEADLRRLAVQFALVCPYNRESTATIEGAEPPAELMARLAQTEWVCYQFLE